MTMEEFGEIREAWTELKMIFDEIEALNESAGIGEMPEIDAYGLPRASAH
jgi:hypothetical protein